jgi:hypothetical protein
VVLGPGGYIIKPRGQMHAMWNTGDSPARMVETIIPGGFEGYFRDLADPCSAPTQRNRGRSPSHSGQVRAPYGDAHWLDDIVKRFRLTQPSH